MVNPERHIPDDITLLTGISDEKVKESGVSLETALSRFLFFIGQAPIVAHNISFDCDFIDAACEICDEEFLDNERIDTLDFSRKKLAMLPSHKLSALAKHFDIQIGEPHRGISDCRTTRALFVKLIEM